MHSNILQFMWYGTNLRRREGTYLVIIAAAIIPVLMQDSEP